MSIKILKHIVLLVLGLMFYLDAVHAQFWEHTFESSGGYVTSVAEITDNSGDYFIRTNGANINASFTNIQGSYYFAAQDIDGETPSSQQTLTFDDVNISSYTNLSFSIYIAEDDDGSNQDWDDSDFMHIDYDIDNSGSWTNLLWVENDGSTYNSAPFLDDNFDGDGEGTEITDAFTKFNKSITGTGSTIDIRITFDLNSGDEDIAIDNLSLTGSGGCTPPGVSSFSPVSGPANTVIIVDGSSFTNPSTIKIGGTSLSTTFNSSTEVIGIVGSGVTTGEVSVEDNQPCEGFSGSDFTIIEESGSCGSGGTSVFISEVADPGDEYKGRFVEIYNPLGTSVNLTGWEIRRYANGSFSYASEPLTGTITSGGTYVVGYKDFSYYSCSADQMDGSVISGNGDDVYVLHNGSSIVDIYGEIGVDGSGEAWEYEDSRAYRNSSVCGGNTVWGSSEWTIIAANTSDMNPCGHSASCGGVSAPSISSQPSDASNICEGSSTTFSVTASGSSLTYQWKVNAGGAGWSDVGAGYSGGTSNNLTINDVTGKDGYQYYCEVTADGSCSKASNAAMLTTQSCGATINTHPSDQDVCALASASFSVSATGVASLTYQWRVLKPGASQWDNVSGGTSATLNINPVTQDMDGNQYFVEITDGNSNCVVSKAALLTVNALPEIAVIADTTMSCDQTTLTRGTPPSGVTWYWQETNANGTNTSDQGMNNQVSSEGTYYLRAQDNTTSCWSDNSASQSVEIRETPTASLIAIPDCGIGEVKVSSDLNQQQTFSLLDDAGNPLSPNREWSGSDSEYTFGGLMDGDYTGKVINQGCEATLAGPVNLTNNPVPAPPLMSDNGVCGNNITVTMTVDTVGGVADEVQFSMDGSTVDGSDNTEPFGYNVNNVMQGSPELVYARSIETTNNCFSEWVVAEASALPGPGTPGVIGGGNTPRCQQDILETYTTTAADVDTFSWEITGASEGSDYTFPGSKTTSSEQVQWDKDFSGSVTISVTAHNVCGSAGPTTANLVIHDSTAITSQPNDQTECEGGIVTFTVTASGEGLSYKWETDNSGSWTVLSNGGDISGATSNNLQIADLESGDEANYRCVVTGTCGEVISDEVVLTVYEIPEVKGLIHLNTK